METYFHGEVIVTKTNGLPQGAKKIEAQEGKYIIADSETTGNHHCLEAIDGADVYEKDGVLYLKASVPVKMFCVQESRHDTEVLEPGIYEIDRAQEFDYLTDMKRKVAD